MRSKRNFLTYITSPQFEKIRRDGFRVVKDYGDYTLCEKVEKGEVLYRECFGNFELYGAKWATHAGNGENRFTTKRAKYD